MDSPWGLAGPIPAEFGKLINMKTLVLNYNALSGTPSLLILPGERRLASKTYSFAMVMKSVRVDPHGIRQAHQHDDPQSLQQPTDGYAPACPFYLAW